MVVANRHTSGYMIIAPSFVLALLLGTQQANAQAIEWGGGDGLWSDSARWIGGDIPDTPSEMPILSGIAPYRVVIDGGFIFGSLTLSNPLARLDVMQGMQPTLFGDIVNNGLIVINPDAINANTRIDLGANTTLSGTGTLRLNGQIAPGNSRLIASGQLTNILGHTIGGSGILNGTIINNSTIVADSPSGKPMWIIGSVTQSDTGVLRATKADLRLEGDIAIQGGTLESTPGARLFATGDIELNNLHNTAQFEIVGTNIQTLRLNGEVINDGSIRLSTSQAPTRSTILFEDGASLGGTGTIFFNTQSLSDVQSYLRVVENGIGTQDKGHSIVGAGWLVIPETSTFVNEGTIQANIPDHQFFLRGNFRGGGRYIAQDTSRFEVFNGTRPTTLDGGVLQTLGNGVFRVQPGVTLSNFTNAGLISLIGRSNTTYLEGQIVNTGTIKVDTHLDARVPTTYSGTGVALLRDYSSSVGASDGGSITNGPGHTFQGPGVISGPFMNNGLVTPMSVSILYIEGLHGPGTGTYDAGDGSIQIQECTINGATLRTDPDGIIRYTKAQFVNITNNGLLQSSSIFESTIAGSFTNNGILRIVGNQDHTIRFLNSLTIEGTGTIKLVGSRETSPPRLFADPEQTVIIGTTQIIEGNGRLTGRFINRGTLDPLNPGALDINPSIRVDDLTLEAGSRLDIELSGINLVSDQILIESNGTLVLGGTLEVRFADGFDPVFGHWALLDGEIGTEIVGDFDQINLPVPPEGKYFRLVRSPTQLTLSLTCQSDINGDFAFNFFDISAFLAAFGEQSDAGDYNEDGKFNFFDISAFLSDFGTCP